MSKQVAIVRNLFTGKYFYVQTDILLRYTLSFPSISQIYDIYTLTRYLIRSQKSVQHTCSDNTHINYIITSTRVPYGNFIRIIEIYGSLLTNSMNPPIVSFIHNVIRDGNYSGLRRKIIYSLREKSITARRNFSRLDSHGCYSSGYDLLIGPRKLNSALGKSLV